MQSKFLSLITSLSVLGIALSSCSKNKSEEPVVSQKYIHKYGYSVSKEEWDANHYPGQVVTNLRNGVVITNTYENNILHGPTTYTYPHSQTLQSYLLYNQGNVVKEVLYDIKGMPVSETIQVSPNRHNLTLWYADGCPMSIEEYAHGELLEGQYFTTKNETESRVEKGEGLRIRRDQQGTLLSKDAFKSGYMVKREAFYPNGTPESVQHFAKNELHGEKKQFSENGEPLAVEEYIHGKLHGKATYFKNGTKETEISYLYGQKNGKEIHYIDGVDVREEIYWENDKRHGPSTYYVEGQPKINWFYDGQEVSHRKFEELNKLDEMVAQISSDVKIAR